MSLGHRGERLGVLAESVSGPEHLPGNRLRRQQRWLLLADSGCALPAEQALQQSDRLLPGGGIREDPAASALGPHAAQPGVGHQPGPARSAAPESDRGHSPATVVGEQIAATRWQTGPSRAGAAKPAQAPGDSAARRASAKETPGCLGAGQHTNEEDR